MVFKLKSLDGLEKFRLGLSNQDVLINAGEKMASMKINIGKESFVFIVNILIHNKRLLFLKVLI